MGHAHKRRCRRSEPARGDYLRRLAACGKPSCRMHCLRRDNPSPPATMRDWLTRLTGSSRRNRLDARDPRSNPWFDAVRQDVRYALRGLRRSPGFTAAVVVTLGLGIGANAAMFNVIDQLMFRRIPYLRQPDDVRRVYLRMPGRERFLTRESFPYARYLDLKRWTTSFSEHAAFFPTTVAVGSG